MPQARTKLQCIFRHSCTAEVSLQHSLFCSANVILTKSCAATNKHLHCNIDKLRCTKVEFAFRFPTDFRLPHVGPADFQSNVWVVLVVICSVLGCPSLSCSLFLDAAFLQRVFWGLFVIFVVSAFVSFAALELPFGSLSTGSFFLCFVFLCLLLPSQFRRICCTWCIYPSVVLQACFGICRRSGQCSCETELFLVTQPEGYQGDLQFSLEAIQTSTSAPNTYVYSTFSHFFLVRFQK